MKSGLPRNGKEPTGIVFPVSEKVFQEGVGLSEKILSRAITMTRGLGNKTCEERVNKWESFRSKKKNFERVNSPQVCKRLRKKVSSFAHQW